ncbi:septum formation initiator family protein [Glycomyces sp. TRM65418]|uniref:FtsB family cell division protein n=1 Tax=Glycomyces sp. TRM65418 TaxID=2867006 RepID=UPI001CE6DBBC|nr:septum formation initiator family protein [Glycomyces sp. TRM65418]MCC3762993.1 septum formation initiator family protein [Glycomyces sp. TRM65418]QZD57010.1 septum formation initiator family protein [Glycomyces sp. TRM65418]
MNASRRPSRPGGRSTGPGRTRATRRPAPGSAGRPQVKRVRYRPARRISRRAAVLALVLSALALSYAYPLRTYIEQRIEINRLEAEQAEQSERIEELEAERVKWDDPEYVKAQIRSSLLLVPPGEDLVIVVDEDDPRHTGGADDAEDPDLSWYDELAATFEDADRLDPEETEEPAE